MEPWADILLVFALVLFRMAGFVVFAPFLGSRNIPGAMKALLAVALAALVFPGVIRRAPVPVPGGLGDFVSLAATETVVGLLFGFAASLLFVGIQLGGHMIGQKMGFSMANVVDPFTEAEVTLVEEFKFFLSLFVFLAVGGHHLLMRALLGTFGIVPVGEAAFRPQLWLEMAGQFGAIFTIALQVAAPALAALFLVTLAMGFLARAVPQINIMMVGFPVQIAIGVSVMVLFLPVLAGWIAGRGIAVLGWNLDRLTRLLAP